MKRVFIDSNALTLLVLGTVNRRYIGQHRRLSVYDQDDFKLVNSYVNSCQEVLTTPNIWTEVDNLCHDSIFGPDKNKYISLMQRINEEWVPDFIEEYMKTAESVHSDAYSQLGLSDAIILELSSKCDLLITGDSRLSDLARANGIEVLDLKLAATAKALQE